MKTNSIFDKNSLETLSNDSSESYSYNSTIITLAGIVIGLLAIILPIIAVVGDRQINNLDVDSPVSN